ncbi:hypothetical protein JXB31_04895 [Candidatus Woesearchaeota archaeon]|nr:hypothetical protein [Candidatus Woesearchaeota archaeon]
MLELRRKILHICTGLIISALIYLGLLKPWMLIVIILLGFILSLISARIKLPFISYMLEMFDRKERIPGKGALTFIIGITLVWILFYESLDIALASIMILTFGDAFSSIFSRYLGRIKHPFSDFKLLEGTIAGVIAGVLSAVLFVSFLEAVTGSLIAMTIEAVGIRLGERIIDDNITIPLSAGLSIFALRIFLG